MEDLSIKLAMNVMKESERNARLAALREARTAAGLIEHGYAFMLASVMGKSDVLAASLSAARECVEAIDALIKREEEVR